MQIIRPQCAGTRATIVAVASLDHSTRRVLVYGVTGSGKTTLAAQISAKTGLPWHSVDDLTWLPGWVQVPLEEQRQKIQTIVDEDAWVLDTAYGAWLDVPLSRVQLIVALDYARWVSFGRLARRAVRRAIDRRPVCNGNVESWRNMFSRDSILLWHLKSFARKRRRIRDWARRQDPPTVVLRSPRETEAWLESLGK